MNFCKRKKLILDSDLGKDIECQLFHSKELISKKQNIYDILDM